MRETKNSLLKVSLSDNQASSAHRLILSPINGLASLLLVCISMLSRGISALPTAHYGFEVIDRAVWGGEKFCHLASWHSNMANTAIYFMHVRWNFKTLPSLTGATSYLGGKWISEDLSSIRSSAVETVQPGTESMPVIFVVQKFNATLCKLVKLLRWNVAKTPALSTDPDMVTGLMNRHEPTPLVTWDGTNWLIPSTLQFDRWGTGASSLPIVANLLDQAPTEAEWDDVRLYRLLMHGLYPNFFDDWWQILDGTRWTGKFTITHGGVPISDATTRQQIINTRFYDDEGYGFKVARNLLLRSLDNDRNQLDVAPFALIYIFNLSDIQSTGGPITVNWRAEKGPGTGIFCDSVFTITYNTGVYYLSTSHNVYHASAASTILATYTSATPKTLFTPAAIDRDSISLAVFTNTLVEELPSATQTLNYKMKTVVHYSVFATCIDGYSGGTPPGPVTASNQLNFVDRLNYDLPKTQRVLDSKVALQLAVDWPAAALLLDVRVKTVVSIEWLPDYPAYVDITPTDTQQLPTEVLDKYCFHNIPLGLRIGGNTCSKFYFQSKASEIANCARRLGGYGWCEYCNPGYGVDLINRDWRSWNLQCILKATCQTPDNYFLWIERDPASIPTPSVSNMKSVCLQCPGNCKSCSSAQECTACSSFSTLTATTPKACPCNAPNQNCAICQDSYCDLCSYYNPDQPTIGRVMHIDASNARTCRTVPTGKCNDGFGKTLTPDTDYKYQSYPVKHFPICRACAVVQCATCADDYLSCTSCMPGYFLINYNDALGTYQNNSYLCTLSDTESVINGGMYPDASATPKAYLKCPIANCLKCAASIPNVNTNCNECEPGRVFSPTNTSCLWITDVNNKNSYLYMVDPADPLKNASSCMPNCAFCQNSTACIGCAPGYRYSPTNATCVLEANCGPTALFTFGSSITFDSVLYATCLECIAYCEVCSTTTTCDRCVAGRSYLAAIQQCILDTDCRSPAHSGYTETVAGASLCKYCGRECRACSAANWCDTCNATAADPLVAQLYHIDLNLCVEPAQCGPPLLSFASTAYCKHCKTNCVACASAADCWQCVAGMVLAVDGSTCVGACPVGATLRNATHCVACPPNCDSCTFHAGNDSLTCQQCAATFHFREQTDECVQCAAQTHHILVGGRCLLCKAKHCEECVTTDTRCGYCLEGFAAQDDGSCTTCPPPDVYSSDRKCLKCVAPHCDQCHFKDLNRCVDCQKGFYLEGNATCQPRSFYVESAQHSITVGSLTLRMQHRLNESLFSLSDLLVLVHAAGQNGNGSVTAIKSAQVEPINSKVLTVKLSDKVIVEQGHLSITFLNLSRFASADKVDFYLSTLNQTVVFENFSQYLPSSAAALGGPAKVAGSSSSVIMVMGTIANLQYAMAMMKIYQMMDFMLLYNVAYPANFQTFLLMFQTTDPMGMLPDVLKQFYDDKCPVMGEKFIIQEMGCQFLSNTSTTLFLFICYFAGKFLLYFVALGVRNRTTRVGKLVHHLKDSTFGAAGLFNLVSMFDMDLLIAAFTNSKYYGGDNLRTVPNILNMGLAITFIFLYPGIILYYFLKTRRVIHNEEGRVYLEKEEEENYAFLMEGKKNNSFYSKYRDVMSLVKNYSICLMLVSYYDQPKAQLISTLMILAGFTVLELVYRPALVFREQLNAVVVGICYSVLAGLFLTLIYMEETMSKKDIYLYLGYPMIGCFSTIILANTYPIVQDTFSKLIELFRKKESGDLIGQKVDKIKHRSEIPEKKTSNPDTQFKELPKEDQHQNIAAGSQPQQELDSVWEQSAFTQKEHRPSQNSPVQIQETQNLEATGAPFAGHKPALRKFGVISTKRK